MSLLCSLWFFKQYIKWVFFTRCKNNAWLSERGPSCLWCFWHVNWRNRVSSVLTTLWDKWFNLCDAAVVLMNFLWTFSDTKRSGNNRCVCALFLHLTLFMFDFVFSLQAKCYCGYCDDDSLHLCTFWQQWLQRVSQCRNNHTIWLLIWQSENFTIFC